MGVTLTSAVPALPARDVAASVTFYRDTLGFDVLHHEGGFAVLGRDRVRLNLWQADDESWRERFDAERPICSGAESFLAGTASCRLETTGVAELYPQLEAAGIVHPRAPLHDTDFGSREFAVLDPDGNLVGFFEWREPR